MKKLVAAFCLLAVLFSTVASDVDAARRRVRKQKTVTVTKVQTRTVTR